MKEVQRLAQLALNTANEAKHEAEKNKIAQESHEKVCAERYKDIKDILTGFQTTFNSSQNTMQTSINNLSNSKHFNAGTWKGIGYVSAALGLLVVTLSLLNLLVK